MNNRSFDETGYPDPPSEFDQLDYMEDPEHGLIQVADETRGKVFIMTRDDAPEAKTNDAIVPRYQQTASECHRSLEWAKSAAVYEVKNYSKATPVIYYVEFFRSRDLRQILGTCNCAARLKCKHIKTAWKKHLEGEQIGFVTKL